MLRRFSPKPGPGERHAPFAYVRKVLTNLVIDRWRRPLREDATEEVPELPVHGDVANGVVVQDGLTRALAGLSARARAIVVLRHFWDLAEAEVAAELEVS